MKSEEGKLLKSGEKLVMISQQGGKRFIAIVEVTQNLQQAIQPHCSVGILKVLQVESPLVIIEGTNLYALYEELFLSGEYPSKVKKLLATLEKTCHTGTFRIATPYDEVLQGNAT